MSAPLPLRPDAGFTLLEALVALAIVAIALAAIGSLAAFNIRGTARLERKLALIETARAVLNAPLPQQPAGSGARGGRIGEYQWQARYRAAPSQENGAAWTPQSVLLSVRSPTGQDLQVETIRLQRSSASKQ